MRTNTTTRSRERTHEGAPAPRITLEQVLRRTLFSCLLWEREFYENGESIGERLMASTIALASNDRGGAELANSIVCEARDHGLRHAPLLCIVALAKCGHLKADTVYHVCDRPDQITELLSLYGKENGGNIRRLSKTMQRGIARAFTRFGAYSLAKYAGSNREVKLRDALFLCHPKGKDEEQQAAFDQLAAGTLPTPDTWEVALSAATDKKAAWNRLLDDDRLGGLAMIRNLRNMREAGVSVNKAREALLGIDIRRIFPYQLIAAGMNAPEFEREIEQLLRKCAERSDLRLPGTTRILVDRSGSMDWEMSGRSTMKRSDACMALAMVAAEVCEDHEIVFFANSTENAGAIRGFQIREGYCRANVGMGTSLGMAVEEAFSTPADRVLVITDEQSADRVRQPPEGSRAYMMNVASAKNGVGYGRWLHIDGFSGSVLQFIAKHESEAYDL